MSNYEQSVEIHLLFKTLAKKVTEEWNKRSGDLLSLPQFRMLYILDMTGRQKAAELAEQLKVTPGAITGMADKLLQRGLMLRQRDEADRRVVYLEITAEGKALIHTLIEEQRRYYDHILSQLEREDIGHLKRILTQIIGLVDTADKEK